MGCTKNNFTACLGRISHLLSVAIQSRPRDQSQAQFSSPNSNLTFASSPLTTTTTTTYLPHLPFLLSPSPSLISPTAPFPLHSCQSYCTAARPNTTPDLLAWAEPAALTCRCSHCVSSAPYLGLAEPKKGRVSTLPQHPSQVQRKPLPQSRNSPQIHTASVSCRLQLLCALARC
jgi:hypothetical protein